MKKNKNNYTVTENELNETEDIELKKRVTWTQVIIGFIAFLILFFSFFYFFEGKPYKVVDSWSINFCESSNPEEYKEIKQELKTIIETNDYECQKVCFMYYPETKYEPEDIIVYFQAPDGTWYFFKDGMTLRWRLPNNLRKKIEEI